MLIDLTIISLLVVDCGGLWSCYDIEFNAKPEKISLGNRKVRKVSCGKEHIVVLTYLGEVYTFGGGRHVHYKLCI